MGCINRLKPYTRTARGIFLLAALVFACFASAGATGFTGKVTGEDGVTPIAGISVQAVDPNGDAILASAVTAGDGTYSLTSISPGTYHLQVDPPGYFPSVRSSHTVASGQDLQVNFALQWSGETWRDTFATDTWSVFISADRKSTNGNVLRFGTVSTGGGDYDSIRKTAAISYALHPYVTIRNKYKVNSGTMGNVNFIVDTMGDWSNRLILVNDYSVSWPWQERTYTIGEDMTWASFLQGDAAGDVDHYFDYLIFHSADRGYVAGQVKTPAGTPLPDTRVQLLKGSAVIGEALSDGAGNYSIWAATSTGGYTVYASTVNGAQFSQASVSIGGRVQTTVNVTLDPFPPAAVPGVRFTATTGNSAGVAWDAYGYAGYWIAFSSDPAFEVWHASQAITAGSPTTLGVYSLEPDTTYYFKVKSADLDDSYYSTAVSSATPPVLPGAVSFSAVYITSAVLQWADGGNPPGTWYQVEYAIDEGFVSNLGFSSGTALSATFGALNPNTTYYFGVRALGFGGQDTAATVPVSTITLAAPPAGEAYALVASTGLSVFWSNNGNPDGTRYEITEATAAAFATLNYSSVTPGNYFEAGGLLPNTTYYYRAAALNGSGLRSAVTEFAPVVTLSAVPLPIPNPTWSLGLVTGTSVETFWLVNNNPNYTEYYVGVSTDVNFNGLDYGPLAWFAAPSYNVTGLESGLTYHFRVKTRDVLNRSSAWLYLGTAQTEAGADNTPPSVNDLQGGDDAWRGAAGGAYMVHFSDLGSGLDKFQVQVTSGLSANGIIVHAWADAVTGINAADYEQDWVLPQAVFETILENVTSYVSVKAFDLAGNSTIYPDAFYVRRDITPPTITSYASSPAGWLAADPGAVFDVDFADALSGLAQVLYSASNQPALADANVLGWTPVDAIVSSPSVTALWGVNFGLLADGASNYISVKAVDAAGNYTVLQDVFRILKNTVGPAVAIAAPQAGYVSTAAVLSGSASAMNEASPVAGSEVAIQELTGSQYYDGTAFASGAPVWLAASGLASWSYNASTVPFAAGTQYKVYARSRDVNSFVTPIPYPSVTFQLDQDAPTVWVSTPAVASLVYAFDAVEGTAADTGGAGLANAEVYLMRLVDGRWWNFQTDAWGDVPVSSAAAPGAAWAFSPGLKLRGGLVHGQQYYVGGAARDAASPANVSAFGSAGSTFTWVDAYAPEAVAQFAPSTGTAPGRVNLAWTFPGDDGGAFPLTFGRYAVQYSTYPEAVFSTQAAQVMISTGLVLAAAPQAYTVAGLNPAATYYFRLWTEDDAGLWSGPSPLASTLSGEALDDMISGSVKNPAGQGITGVMVEAITNSGLVVASVYTLDDGFGSFTLPGLPDGLYRVQATWLEDGFSSSIAKDQIPMGYADANFELSVAYELASVSGSVPASAPSSLRPSAAGAAGVQLWQGSRLIASASPDASGRFSIRNLLPGSYTLRAAGTDGVWKSFTIQLAGGEDLQVTPLGALLRQASAYAYPNPARGFVKFRLYTEVAPVRFSLAVYSLDGSQVKAAEETFSGTGVNEYLWTFTGGRPASGVYFYTLRLKYPFSGETESVRGKFAVIR